MLFYYFFSTGMERTGDQTVWSSTRRWFPQRFWRTLCLCWKKWARILWPEFTKRYKEAARTNGPLIFLKNSLNTHWSVRLTTVLCTSLTVSASALLLSHTLLVFVSCVLGLTQPWAQCCTGSVWVWCLTTLTLKLSISLTASPSCSRLPHPCCTYLLGCWDTLERKFGGTMWRLGMGSSVKVGLRGCGPGWAFIFCFDCPHCTVWGAVSNSFYILLVPQRTAASKTSTGSCVRRLTLQRSTLESWLACSCWTSCPLKISRPAWLSLWLEE